MARQPREDAPGVVHHVMVRGIERRRIFADDPDREELLRRLCVLVPELGFRCFGWALMPNHAHLLLRSGATSISRLMARLGTGYARYFNARHDRVGHLFQNRFRSRRAVDDADLVGLVLYVCRNPLEAGLARDAVALESYPWCSVGALTGRRAPYPFEAVAETLTLFDADAKGARERFRSWLGMPSPEPWAGRLPAAAPEPELGFERDPVSIERLIREVCAEHSVDGEELCSWRRRDARVARARAVVAVRAVQELRLSGAAVARALQVSPSAVTRMLARAAGRRTQPGKQLGN